LGEEIGVVSALLPELDVRLSLRAGVNAPVPVPVPPPPAAAAVGRGVAGVTIVTGGPTTEERLLEMGLTVGLVPGLGVGAA
jgi:hypothetical protein